MKHRDIRVAFSLGHSKMIGLRGDLVKDLIRIAVQYSGISGKIVFGPPILNWGLVNEAFFVGHTPSRRPSDSMGGMMAGLDFSYPIPLRTGAGDPLRSNWDVSYSWFNNHLKFLSGTGMAPASIDDEWRIGFASARENGPFRLWLFNFQQLGLPYRFDSSGDFTAISLNLRAPFTR